MNQQSVLELDFVYHGHALVTLNVPFLSQAKFDG